jgi:hypothetical protein
MREGMLEPAAKLPPRSDAVDAALMVHSPRAVAEHSCGLQPLIVGVSGGFFGERRVEDRFATLSGQIG